MRVLINCSNLKVGGGLQVAHSFLNEIGNNAEHDFHVILSETLNEQIDQSVFLPNFSFQVYSIRPTVIKALLGNDAKLNKIEESFNPDRVFSVFGPTYWKPKAKHICGFAKPGYIYKESPFFKTLSSKESIKLKTLELLHMFSFRNHTDIIITENEDVSSRLQKRIKKETYTVTNYFNQVFLDNTKWDNSIEIPKTDSFKFLTISANYPHKNLEILKKVIPILLNKYPKFKFKFYLTISEEDFGFLPTKSKESITFLGKVSINQCPNLYSQCDFLFLPTLLECFSASYCEAMVMKKPILTSNLSFAKGICKDSAVYFDPMNPENIADVMYELVMNKEKQMELINKGIEQLKAFDNSSQRAEKYLQVITN
jgi:glycosyltransferase involved in cell wall biosynthesis